MQSQTTQKVVRVDPMLANAPDEPNIKAVGYTHTVDFGRGVRPRIHTVFTGECGCADEDCPAPRLVTDWLATEYGQLTAKAPTGYLPFLPKACPICNGRIVADHTLSSSQRGIGWQCINHGTAHYWLHKWAAIKDWYFRADLLPGVQRGQLPVDAKLGYLPECNH